jgi:plastocyanin
LVVAAWGCGGSGDDSAGGSARTTVPDVPLQHGRASIRAVDNDFQPGVVRVVAGTEVVWTNRGRNDHDVQPVHGRGFGVTPRDFARGDSYTHVFAKPGTYAYYCTLHGTKTKGMVGTVVVETSSGGSG